MARRIDKTLLQQVNSQTLIDEEDQTSLIKQLNLINDENFKSYLKLLNYLTIVEIGLIIMVKLIGASGLTSSLITANLVANGYKFNISSNPAISYISLGLTSVCGICTIYDKLFIILVINYVNYYYLFSSFTDSGTKILGLSNSRYKYKDV